MVLGVWILILPYLGFPDDWKKNIALVTGILVVIIAYKVKPDAVSRISDAQNLPYIEHRNE
ncbi:MAG: hypothetical protein JWO00_426 [Candidatus Parcubacteria bacterium]|nr:hypothetical protein [Candidatus Parcubacteria bacterium]